MTIQIIPKPEILLNKIQALPPEQLQQIEDFIEFLTQKYVHPNIKDIIPQPPGDRGKAGSRVSLERGGKPTRAVLTASNILDHDAGH